MNEMTIKKATIINAMGKYSQVIANIIFTVILARILTPEEYGVVAVITVFTNLFSVLSDAGLGTAIIQNKNLSSEDTNSIFAFSIYFAVLLACIFAVLAYPISIVFHNPVYIKLCLILILSILFNTLNMVPNGLLLKEKKFKSVAFRTISVTLLTGIVTVVLALLGFKYYALVIQSVLSSLAIFLWNFKSSDIKITLKLNRLSLEKIRHFSIFQFLFSFINYISRNLDNLLIGIFMGSSNLAYYDKGYKLMCYPLNYLTNVITPVLHPILSDYKNDSNYIYTKYQKVVKLLSLLGIFISLFCYFNSKEIIMIMFGKQWSASIPCFKYLSLSIWTQMLMSSTGSIYQSLDKTKLMFKSGLITAMVTVTCIFIGLYKNDITFVSLMILIAFSINFIITFYLIIKKCFKLSLLMFAKSFIPDVMIAIILIISFNVSTNVVIISNGFFSVLVIGVINGCVYLFALSITKELHVFSDLFKKN